MSTLSQSNNPPIQFHSIYQSRIWGGQNIRTILGRSLPDNTSVFGEAWEISDRPEAMSVVVDGPWREKSLHELWEKHRETIFGSGYEHYERFPLLCKILDATDNLSVQVHPPEETAKKWNGEGKNEIWYILHSEPNAAIYSGISELTSVEELENAAKTDRLGTLLKSEHLNPGEHLYIPAGMIHSIGEGNLIAEIQQNSDTTYRLYDWGRKDKNGNSRDLHLEQALDCIREFGKLSEKPSYLTEQPYFTTTEFTLKKGEYFTQPDISHFAIFTVLRGSIEWNDQKATMGGFILSPVNALSVMATEENTLLLCTTVPS